MALGCFPLHRIEVVGEVLLVYRNLQLGAQRSGVNDGQRLTLRGNVVNVGIHLDIANNGCRIFLMGRCRLRPRCKGLKITNNINYYAKSLNETNNK